MLRNLLARWRRPHPAAIAARMVALERLTCDPSKARFAVMAPDGSMRLVAEHLFLRGGDIMHPRGTPAFDQFVRYWNIERACAEARMIRWRDDVMVPVVCGQPSAQCYAVIPGAGGVTPTPRWYPGINGWDS